MLRSYYHALTCSEVLVQEDGKLQTVHCKTRICPICGAIRTAKAVDAYLPIVKGWDAYLVTLTVPNVLGCALKSTIDEMIDVFRNCTRSIKRKMPFLGIRKLEVTFNSAKRTYHPHFHVIVDGRAAAMAVRLAWLDRYPRASDQGQDLRKCDKNSLRELFKYAMKVLSSDSDKKGDPRLSPAAVDTIVQALSRKRTFQNFGFKLVKELDEDDFDGAAMEAPVGSEAMVAEWRWYPPAHNWVCIETGELLARYKPSTRRLRFLEVVAGSG